MSLTPLRICLTIGALGLAVAATSQIAPLNLERSLYSAAQGSGSSAAVLQTPGATADLSSVPSAKRHIQVTKAEGLQQAIDKAEPGDWLELEKDATYEGPFHLPVKKGSGWIVVASTAADELAAPGNRVTPSRSAAMAKLRASSDFVIVADPGAHHYRFIGVEILPAAGTSLNALVQLGNDET